MGDIICAVLTSFFSLCGPLEQLLRHKGFKCIFHKTYENDEIFIFYYTLIYRTQYKTNFKLQIKCLVLLKFNYYIFIDFYIHTYCRINECKNMLMSTQLFKKCLIFQQKYVLAPVNKWLECKVVFDDSIFTKMCLLKLVT